MCCRPSILELLAHAVSPQRLDESVIGHACPHVPGLLRLLAHVLEVPFQNRTIRLRISRKWCQIRQALLF